MNKSVDSHTVNISKPAPRAAFITRPPFLHVAAVCCAKRRLEVAHVIWLHDLLTSAASLALH